MIVALTLAAVLLVGAVGLGVYYGAVRPSHDNAAPAGGTESPSTTRNAPEAPAPRIHGWQVGYNPRNRLAYDVPSDWNVLDPSRGYSVPALGDVTFHGLVDGPYYQCAGERRTAGRVVSTAVEPDRSMAETAREFLRRSGRNFYAAGGAESEVSVETGTPSTTDVGGFEAVRLSGTVRVPESSPCLPTKARIATLVIRAKDTYVVLLAGADSLRPDSSPPAEGEELVPRILDSARPVR